MCASIVSTYPGAVESDPTNARTILHVRAAVGCNASLTISSSTTDTRSSAWVDYMTDTMYVGSDNGRVYKITGVFKGTPTLAGAPRPKLIAGGQHLSGPVFDDVTNKLLMGTGTARVYSVSAGKFQRPLPSFRWEQREL